MRLQDNPYLSAEAGPQALVRQLDTIYRQIATQTNLLSEGFISAATNATTAAPTTGTYAQGDFIRNSAPTVLGTAGSRYVIHGWICVAAGTPGTWAQCRYLTGT